MQSALCFFTLYLANMYFHFVDLTCLGCLSQVSPGFCRLSPTHSDTSVATLSPDRRDASPDDCDGSASCRCGIINCVTGQTPLPPPPLLPAPAPAPSSHPLPLPLTLSSKPLTDQPRKLFQPYKNDLSEKA